MKFLAAILTISVAQAQAAAPVPAAPPPCVSRAEMEDMVFYLLPVVLPAMAEKCASSLPANSWLGTEAAAYAARLAGDRAAHWPGVHSAFLKIGGPIPRGAKEADIKRTIDDSLSAMLVPARVRGADCVTIDEAARLLAPLPPENLARLASLLVQKSTAGERPRGVPVCPAA